MGNWLNTDNPTLWNTGTESNPIKNTTNDPCPDGWRVPTQSEWVSIFNGGTTSGAPSTATANDWLWNGTGMPGYLIKPKGATVYTLFLPAAGQRLYNNGALYLPGSNGYYWSSSASGTYSGYVLNFNGTSVYPGVSNGRASGFSVRCVAVN